MRFFTLQDEKAPSLFGQYIRVAYVEGLKEDFLAIGGLQAATVVGNFGDNIICNDGLQILNCHNTHWIYIDLYQDSRK